MADIATCAVTSVDETTTLAEIGDLLEEKRIKRVPVMHDGKIVGMVRPADLLKVLVSGGAGNADTSGTARSAID